MLVQRRFKANCIDVLEIDKDADLRLRCYHQVLVLELVLASEPYFPSLAEVDELYLKLILFVYKVDVESLIWTIAMLLKGYWSLAHLRLRFLDCFKYCCLLLRLMIVLYVFKYGERFARDPETILVLVRCHCNLAAQGRHELRREF